MGLVDRLLSGDRRALSRIVTIVENGGPDARRAVAALYPHTGRAQIVGVTGPPGAGKSTLVNQLALELRRRGRRLAVLAVDPTSPFSGGAILGDRIRMAELTADPDVFVRSMATRGQLGGIARATGDVVKVLDAAGFELVLVETVGAGQAEVEIASEADTTLVVEVPGLGDDVQAIKAGILEIADIFVVNKADRQGAAETRRHLQTMLQLGGPPRDGWSVPILMTVAANGQGVPELADNVAAHWKHLCSSGSRAVREQRRIERELERLLRGMALALVHERVAEQQYEAVVARVQARAVDPYAAAERMLADALGVAEPT